MLRTKKSSASNMRFLFGSVAFFAMIIISIMLFTYYAMREAWNKSPDAGVVYTVSFSPAFNEGCYKVFMDDSLLYAGCPFKADTVLRVARYVTQEPVTVAGIDTVVAVQHFTASSSLFVVDARTDKPSIIGVGESRTINLDIKEGRVVAELGK